jgi:hypothetical protein
MNKTRLICALSLAFAAVIPAFSDDATISSYLDDFTTNLTEVIPENTTQLSVWPDAYIGKFIPSVPPHFGLGLSLSGTLMDTSQLSGAINDITSTMQSGVTAASDAFNITLPTLFSIPDRFVMPVYSVNARIGGFILPFDIGIFGSYAYLDKLIYSDFTGSIDYLSFGTDVRYALYEGNVLLPKISLGAGYIFSRQSLGFNLSKSYEGSYNSYTGTITGSSATSVYVTTNTLYAQLQVSKKFLFLVPYAGVRAVLTSSTSGYSFSYISEIEGDSTPIAQGSSSKSYATNGFDFANLQPQIYAGLGFNAPFSQFTLNACWNPRNNLWSASLNSCFRM